MGQDILLSATNPKRVRPSSDITAHPQFANWVGAPSVPLKEAGAILKKSQLITTKQQLRDAELQKALEDFSFDANLIDIVTDYAPESSFAPLERDVNGTALNNQSNQPILREVFKIIRSEQPGFEHFYFDVTEHHTRALLDQLVIENVSAKKHLKRLSAIRANDPEALHQHQQKLRTIVKYLPETDSRNLLKIELAGPVDKDDIAQPDAAELWNIHAHLFIEALENRQPDETSEKLRKQTLECQKARLFQKQAQALSTSQKFNDAYAMTLKALDIFCTLNLKRDAVAIVVELIEQYTTKSKGQTAQFQEVQELFLTVKNLCLKYPQDYDLYARLLFSMDEYCFQQGQNAFARELHQQAEAEQLAVHLAPHYKTHYAYRKILTDYRAGLPALTALHQVMREIDRCYKLNGQGYYDRQRDLNRVSFFCVFAKFFVFAAELSQRLVSEFDQLPEQERETFLDIAKMHVGAESRLYLFNPERYPSLRHKATVFNPLTRQQLDSISAEHYKNALKTLLAKPTTATEGEPLQKLFVAYFGKLVSLYRRNNDSMALKELLAPKHVLRFNGYPEFQSKLVEWRKQLKAMKGRSRPT